ncbi:MAG: hypothetical protein ABL986_08765 [Vicinamibacterales bacterium]
MKIKTNIRAGKGGASGAGKNRSSSTDSVDTTPVYVPPVSRCTGL